MRYFKMRTIRNTAIGLTLALSTLAVACATEPATNTNSITAGSPAPSASTSPVAVTKAAPLPLPVLDALFSDDSFKSKLKSKLELTDDQLGALQKIAGDEVVRLRQSNIEEQSAEQSSQAEQSARTRRGSNPRRDRTTKSRGTFCLCARLLDRGT